MSKAIIKTSGDLRTFLANVMTGVTRGDVSVEKAAVVVKAASQINESFYAEIKTRQVEKQLSGQSHELGKLPVGGDVPGDE